MYSQYSYNTSSIGGGGGETTTAVAAQQWDGSKWVVAGGTNSTGGSYYQANQAQPGQHVGATPPGPIPAPPNAQFQQAQAPQDAASLVSLYSQYYQYWQAQGNESKVQASTMPPGPQRDEAMRRAQWAEYYADQSSRAAHYYNTYPGAASTSGQAQHQPPPPPPPPPPPSEAKEKDKAKQSRWGATAAASPSSSAPQSITSTTASTTGSASGTKTLNDGDETESPESLRRYVHRCLTRCPADDGGKAREYVQSRIEQLVSNAIENGTLQSTDWDAMDIVSLPGEQGKGARDTSKESMKSSSGNHRSLSSHHGVSGDRSIDGGSGGGRSSGAGRAGGSSSYNYQSSSPRSSSSHQRQQQQQPVSLPLSYSSFDSAQDDAVRREHGTAPPPFKRSRSHGYDYYGRGSDEREGHGGRSYGRMDSGSRSDGGSYYGPGGGDMDRDDGTDSFGRRSAGTQKRAASYKRSFSDYDATLPQNDSYYGGGSSLGAEEFISLASPSKGSKSKGGKAKKGKSKHHQHQHHHHPKKKSSPTEGEQAGEATTGFERSHATLAKRAGRFAGKGGILDAATSSNQSDAGNVERYMGKSVIGGKKVSLSEDDFERMTVKGTCQVLEKNYLRLTAPPRAEAVRPQTVLEKHLENLKRQWGQRDESSGVVEIEGGGKKKRDYEWFCSQLKAVRQDLTVQRINNAFAVDVYETHARIALEVGDRNEFNQCQTQLRELYDILLHEARGRRSAGFSEDRRVKTGLENMDEFIAYRIIYYVFLTGNKKYEGGSSDLFKIMLSLTPAQKAEECIRHALSVRVAVAEYDYHAFFQLQDTCPKMGAYLMDFMVPSVRQWALQRICKAFRPDISLSHVLNELGFDVKEQEEVEDGKAWLLSCGCKLSEDGKTLLTKDSVVRESSLKGKSSLI